MKANLNYVARISPNQRPYSTVEIFLTRKIKFAGTGTPQTY